MGAKIVDVMLKLTKVYVPPFITTRNGKVVHGKGYWREARKGENLEGKQTSESSSPAVAKVTKALAPKAPAKPAKPTVLKPRTPYPIKAAIHFQETEHTGDLEHYWSELAPHAQKHGVQVTGMQALQDVSEEDNSVGPGIGDPYYEGGGRYEEGVITVKGTDVGVGNFLRDAKAAGAAEGFMSGVSHVEYTGDRPPPPKLKVGEAKLEGSTMDRHKVIEVSHEGRVVGKVIQHPKTSSYPGSFNAPHPEYWSISGVYGKVGQFATAQEAFDQFKKLYAAALKPRL